mmetsp:Transcript_126284/g.269390  ORF Transcript_126284/g.269390 Transcript_126284/m.269390 type:complete len:220 (-) Transcript_126284:136-795(-)
MRQAVELPLEQFRFLLPVRVYVDPPVLFLTLVGEPVVDFRVDVVDIAEVPKHGDEGKEERAIQTVQVQVLWRSVGRRDHYCAALEQNGKETLHDDGVADVSDLELVKAEEPTLDQHLAGYLPYEVVRALLFRRLALLGFQLLLLGQGSFGGPDGVRLFRNHCLLFLQAMEPFVHINHPLMEVDTLFALHRHAVEEQVHEKGLTSPAAPEDVEPLRPVRH